MSIVHDMGLPAIWGYNLDVGKRNVGVVLGWGNMWGNLGAFVSPLILLPLTGMFATKKAGYDALFSGLRRRLHLHRGRVAVHRRQQTDRPEYEQGVKRC